MRKLFILSSILAFAPIFALAHGNGYLEFNPDYFKTKSLNVSTAGTIYQIFLPSNEFLGGADFWFDNAGGSGAASFELRDQNNNLVASKNITIPHINPVSGGQRVHVDFSSQSSVIGSNIYKIRISSALPQLQIYYSDRIKFLGHNQPHISDYINGAAEINGEEQQFSFKYTLYEMNETSAPIISNVSWAVVSETQMRVDFNANEPVDYRLEYGPSGQGYSQSTNFTAEYQFCAEGVLNCSIGIPVSSDTSYQYRLTAKDSWGNQSQVTGTFISGEAQTPAPSPTDTPASSATPSPTVAPDLTPPVISNLRIVEVTNNSVSVAWTTNEAANSHLLISLPQLITITSFTDEVYELEHFLQTDGSLSQGGSYIAKVTSSDANNNEGQASISFSTLNSAPTPTPTPSSSAPPQPTSTTTPQANPTIAVTSAPSSGTGNIQWGASPGAEPSDGYRVDVFDKEGNFVKTVYVPAGSHSVNVPGLEKGDYSVIVYSNDDGVYKKVDKPAQLKVEDTFLQRLLALWPYLLVVAGLIVAFILWEMMKMHKASQAPKTPVV